MTTGRGLPWWMVFVLLALFAPAALLHEGVFGGGVGLVAALAGVVVGLGIALVASLRRWEPFTTIVVGVAAYLLLGGVAALRDTTIAGVLPSLRTIQLLVVQAGASWKDLLTLAPPASSYTGPAVLPWLTGLVCGLVAGLLVLRSGRYLLGSMPLVVFAAVGIAWGPGGQRPEAGPVIAWVVALLAWWAWCSQRRRTGTGQEVLVGRRAVGSVIAEQSLATSLTESAPRTRVAVVHLGRRVVAAALTLGLAAAVTPPVLSAWRALDDRVVLRDLVVPPLDVKDYASPLAAFRHYTTDLERTTLVTVSSLPAGARLRLGVMDTYNGIAFGMSDPGDSVQGRYLKAGRQVRATPYAGTGTAADVTVDASGLVGPWLPSLGIPDTVEFTGDDASALAGGLYANQWSQALLSTASTGTASYRLGTVVPPVWSDGQLAGASTPTPGGTPDTGVPDGVAELAVQLTADHTGALDEARAIERYLSRRGYFSNQGSADSRSGHRADRLARMLAAQRLIGDDEQYATLMALMLHTLGIPARVVMGLYPGQYPTSGAVTLTGADVHAWVEVEFTGIGWATFDPTPPRDQVPQTEVSKPRSIPKPQVLQPPDPPEPPVELPPSVTERNADNQSDDAAGIPWAVVGGSAGVVLLVAGPLVAIAVAKARRRRRRRDAADPVLGVAGAWNEVLDLAADAGVRVPADLTRQEAAVQLDTTLAGSAGATTGSVLTLARRTDAAVFAPDPPAGTDVAAAWSELGQVEARLDAGAGWWTRLRRRFSLRSLRLGSVRRRSLRRGSLRGDFRGSQR